MKSTLTLFLSLVLGLNAAHTLAAGGVVKSPTGTAPDRYVYYPGTEGKRARKSNRARFNIASPRSWL